MNTDTPLPSGSTPVLSAIQGQHQPSGAGLAGILELSDPLRDVYLALVRLGDLSMDEIISSLADETPNPEEIPIYVRILARQGQLERYQGASGVVRFRAILSDKAKKSLPDDIWDALA